MLRKERDRDLDRLFVTFVLLLVGVLAATGLGALTLGAAWVMKGPY